MTKDLEKRFLAAIDPLRWEYAEGDDGDQISLALDEAASLFQELPRFNALKSRSLDELLGEVDAPPELANSVQRLYEICRRFDYSGGLSESAASKVSKLGGEVADELAEYFEKVRKARKRRKRSAASNRGR